MLKKLLLTVLITLINYPVTANDFNYQVEQQNELLTLSNGTSLEIAVSPKHGGELSGIKIKTSGQWHQIIYRGENYQPFEGWRGKALLLWPATGMSKVAKMPITENKMGHYQVNSHDSHNENNKTYSMPFHGFAKTMPWTVDNISSNNHYAKVTLSIKNNDYSQNFYPFVFQLSVTYRLSNDELTITYKVHSGENNQQPMPFSIGNHITFKAPLIKGSDINNFKFKSNSKYQLERIKGLPTGKTLPSPFVGKKKFTLLPEKNSLSLSSNNKIATLTLLDPSGVQVKLSHQASSLPENLYVDFNLWASQKEGFISPEPWLGAQNSLNSGLGLIKLKPNEQWQWQITINLAQTNLPNRFIKQKSTNTNIN